MTGKPTTDFKFCNHHHEIDEDHELVTIGGETFVANKAAIPLLEALAGVGLKTRTHHIGGAGENSFVGILMDNIDSAEPHEVCEVAATRTTYNGKKELLIQWTRGAK